MTTSAQSTSDLHRLRDVATFVRSKNAGPFMITIDLFFETLEASERVVSSKVFTAETIGKIYRVDPATVIIIHSVPAVAIKISFPRPYPGGGVGECDVAGGQQYAPLLDVLVPGVKRIRKIPG